MGYYKSTRKRDSLLNTVGIQKTWGIITKSLNGRVLDVGSSDAVVTSQYSGTIIGLDLMKSTSLIPLVVGGMHEMPFTEESFDSVVISHTLEHTENPCKVLKEVYRILKDGGRVIVNCPNKSSWRGIVFSRRYDYVYARDHKTYFNFNSLTQLVENCGFEVIEKRGSVPSLWVIDKIAALPVLRGIYDKLGDLDMEHSRDVIIVGKKY